MSFAHTFEMSNNNKPYKIKNLNIQVLAPTNIRQFFDLRYFSNKISEMEFALTFMLYRYKRINPNRFY